MDASGEGELHELDELTRMRARVAELEAALEESRRATSGLREAKQWLEILLQNAPDVIIVTTPDGEMLYSNRAAAGNRIEDVIGASAFRYLLPEEVAGVREVYEAVAATGKSEVHVAETVFGTIWESRVVRLPGTESPPRLMTIAADVTERRRLEEQLRQAQKMEAVGELAAGIAHNFNNLLTAIIPGIQLAIAKPGPLQRDWLRDAEYAAHRAAELVRELMLFARHGKTAAKSPVDVRELLSRAVSMCRSTFDPALTIELVDSSMASLVSGHGGQLEQVFLNVCFNARDAVGPPGSKERSLRIALDAVSDDAPGSNGRFVRICFTDNGSGMTDEVRARIFEPFFTTKAGGNGNGLGLATAYAIVDDHGGKLLCESTAGVGTTFTVLLPAAGESAVRPAGDGSMAH